MTDLSILGSKGESKQHTPVESPDSLINISYANILDGISEGPIVGLVNGAQSIYLDKTPLANSDGSLNFTGVTWEQRTGEHDQDHISGFPAVESQSSVGVELKASQPWVQAFSNLELSAVRVQLSASALVVTEKDGDRVGYRVAYEIDLSTDGSDYKVVHSGAFDGKTTTGYQRSIRIDLPKATRGWRLRVRRTTPDSTTSNTQATTSVGTYTEIIDAKLQYPYTALCGLKIDASQFSSIPERAYRIRGRIIQVPSNYTPATRAYAGTWDGTFKLAWTDCPAWIWRDIVLNDRYGLGRFIDSSQLDKWALYQIARYCDEMVSDGKGGREPRFTCNVYLQSRADALTVLQDLASVFRGMSYYASSQVACAADMPGDPVYTYTNANVIDGKFSRAGSSGSTRFSVAKVAWSDRENFGNQRVEYVQDQKSLARYGVRETEITAFGCVSQGQAQRAGQYILLTNRLETGTITFSVGLDGTICRPGDVIRVADQHYAGAPLAGRVKAATASTVTLDDDVKVAAGDTLVVILPKGVAETRVVRSVAGRVVTVTQAFSAVPVKESVYTIETSTLVAETYRVLTVNENFGDDKLQYDVVAIARNNSKFAAIDDGAQIIIPPTSVLPAAVQAPPTNVKLSTFDTLNQGINIATMRITWDAPRGAQSYRVWWKRNSGDWVYAGVTYTAAIEVRGIYSGTYTARVSAEGVAGNSSVWALSEPTALFGKIGEPPALASLKAESLLFGIGLTWAFPPGAEDTQRTELWYSEGTDLAKATKLADLAYPQDKHTLQGLRAGQRFYFWARLVDKSGNIGPWFPSGTTLVAGMASADAGPILEQIKDQITESELGKALTSKIEKIELIDGNGPSSVNERVGSAKTELARQITDVNNTLSGVKNTLEGQVSTLSKNMADAKSELQQQITAVSTLAGSLPYRKDKTYSINQSALGSDGKLYQAVKAVPLNTPPPNATYWTDVGQAVVTAAGTAASVTKLQTDVTTLGDKVTATAGKLEGFQASIDTANSNASAAQGAAQAANDLAGGKGKVIVQSAAPAAADRLPQNLWIDTTSGANTPKRWNGSAWVSVSDKVATDAAAAAQSALNQVGSKADASAVNSLKLTVDQQGRDLTSQGTTLNGLQTTIDGKASSQALQQVTSRVTATEDKDKAQDQLISSQSQALISLTDSVSKKADSLAVQSLSNEVKQQGESLTSQSSSITKLNNSLAGLAAAGSNLLVDGGFEATALGPFSDGNVVAANARTGTNSLLIAPAAANVDVLVGEITVSPGRTIYAEAYAKASVVTSGGGAVHLQLQFRANGMPLAWASLQEISVSQLGGAFSKLSGKALVPAGYEKCRVYTTLRKGADEAARINVDDVFVADVTEAQVATDLANTKADATAVNSLTARVSSAEGTIVSQGKAITSLNNTVSGKADSSALQSLSSRVTATESKNTTQDTAITSQGQAITSLNNALPGKADSSAVAALSGTVAQQGSALTSQGNSITSLNNSVAGLAAAGSNLILDGSFEAAAIGPYSDGAVVSAHARTGTNSLLVIPAGASANRDVALSEMAVSPGRILYAEVFAKASNAAVSADGRVDLQLQFSGKNVPISWSILQAVPISQVGSAFSKISGRSVVPVGYDKCRIYITLRRVADTAARFNFDDLYVADVTEAQAATDLANTKADATAVNGISTRVSNAEGEISSQGSAITSLNNALSGKADASAVSALNSEVKQQGSSITSQSSSILSLSNAITGLAAAGANLLLDGGFEAAPLGAFSGGTVVAANARTGANSLLIAPAAGNADVLVGEFSVSPGRTIYAEAYAKASVVTSGGGSVDLQLQFRTSAQSVAWASLQLVNLNQLGSAFTKLSGTATVPAGHDKCRVYATLRRGADAAARINIDDVFVADVTEAQSAIDLANTKASSSALQALSSTVSQQGTSLTAETKRIDGLYTSVGNNSSAIQDEATTRTNADSALSTRINTAQAKANEAAAAVQSEITARANAVSAVAKRVDDTQTSLGNTNAMVNRTSEAVTGLNNVTSASEVVRVQITANGIRHIGGFGIGIENKGGVVQSTFAILADRFAILSPSGDSLSSPFAIQGNQTFIADAYIRDASITNAKIANASISNAKIADAAISAAKIGVAEVDTLRIRGNAVTVPISYSVQGQVRGAGRFQWMDIMNISVPMDEAGYVFIMFNCGQYYTSGERASGFTLTINGFQLMGNGGQPATPAPVVSGSIAVGPGIHNIKVTWYGDDASIFLDSRNIFVIGTKR